MWIARNKNNDLYIYVNKPIKYEENQFFLADTDGEFSGFFNTTNGLEQEVQICSSLYPEVTWENRPIELSLYQHVLCG